MLAVRACTGHVLHEQTHTGLLDSEVASIPAGPEQENTRATGMVFPVNTLVLQCRCHAGGRAAQGCVSAGARRQCVHYCVPRERSGRLSGK